MKHLFAVTIVVWCSACAGGTGEVTDRDRFVGHYRLASRERLNDQNEWVPSEGRMGRDAVGMITYSADGHMTVQIMRRDRPAFAAGTRADGTPDEVRAAFDGYLAYFGTYEVDEEEGAVTHQLEGALYPNWLGAGLKRFYAFSGNRLTLTVAPARRARLHWERVSPPGEQP